MLCQCVGAHEGGYVVDGLVGFPWGCGVGRDFWPKQVNVCLPLNKSRYCLLFSLRAWRETKVGTCSWSFGLPWGGCSYVHITAGEQSMHPMGPRWEVLPWALNIHSDLRVLCSHNPNIKLLFFFFLLLLNASLHNADKLLLAELLSLARLLWGCILQMSIVEHWAKFWVVFSFKQCKSISFCFVVFN